MTIVVEKWRQITPKLLLSEHTIETLRGLAAKDGLSDQQFDKWVDDSVEILRPIDDS